jgi:hypothetical protein
LGGAAHHSSGLETSSLVLRKTSSDWLAASSSPSDTTLEETKSLPQRSQSTSPPADTDYKFPGTLLNQCPLSAVERALIHVDPFANLPIQLDRAGQALYSFSIPLLTDDSFATTLKSPALTRSIRIYPHYNSEVRVCATLLLTSAYLDEVRHAGVSHQTVKWKFNLIQSVNRVISNEATQHGDDAFNGVMLLLLSEARKPRRQECRIHSRALMQVMSRRGERGYLSDHVDVGLAILTSKAQIAYLDTHSLAGLALRRPGRGRRKSNSQYRC